MENRIHTLHPRGGTPPRGPGGAGVVRGLAAVLAALLPIVLPAQGGRPAAVRPVDFILDDNGNPHPLLKQNKGFRLFAEEDLAGTGMKMTGGYGWGFSNIGGPCPLYLSTTPSMLCGFTRNAAGNFQQTYFVIDLVAGAPPSAFNKIRAVHPNVARMRPPVGYTTPFTLYIVPPVTKRWGPADGQFGAFYSGALSTEDGSCKDNSSGLNGFIPANFTLLAGSDCPDTWPASGFDGKRNVKPEAWAAAFRANPNGFHFEEWKLPPTAYDTTFIGSFSTYGASSDSYRDLIQRYGAVTPRGRQTDDPVERGYPLGLEYRFDAWQFNTPALRNAVFWQVTLVNNSERVYGTGIDYDSLYFGLMTGYLANGQTLSWYHDFRRNTVWATGGGTSRSATGAPLCSATYPRRTPVTGACLGGGFGATVQAITWLKSPIGDMRNKLLSDPSSAFHNPTSPFADDTITYNHAHRSSFGMISGHSVRSDRALFGYISSTEANFLDGRTIADFSATTAWTFFQSEDFNGTLTESIMKFPKFVPGNTPGHGRWDYNNDGVQDSISVPTCGRTGCVPVWSDITAAGLENRAGNIGNPVTAGPFALAAGDTTQFLFAFHGSPDSLSAEAQANAIIAAYMNFFPAAATLTVRPFTPGDVDVTPAQVRDSVAGVQTARVRIRIRQPAPFTDPTLQAVVQRLDTATRGVFERLRRLNPGLRSAINARVTNNLAEVWVFKSCDRGVTWTVATGGGCAPAPAVSPTGTNILFGVRPISRIGVTAAGFLTSNVFQEDVMAGRTYLYSFVTRTRGLADVAAVDSVGCGDPAGDPTPGCQRILTGPVNLAQLLNDQFNIQADTLTSALARNGPTTVLVYAPISLPAGSKAPALDTVRVTDNGSRATQRVQAIPRNTIAAGNYRVVFANRFIVTTERDTVTGASTQTIVAQRIIPGSSSLGGQTATNRIVSSMRFVSPGEVTLQGTTTQGTGLPNRRTGLSGSKALFTDTVVATNFAAGGVGYLLAREAPSGTDTTKVFFLSQSTASPPASFEAASDFPGFVLLLEALPAGATPRNDTTVQGVTTSGVNIRPPNDTTIPTVVDNFGVVYQAARSVRAVGAPGGTYEVQWKDDAYGPRAPFTLGTVTEMQPELDASLRERAVGMVGDTTAATRARLQAAGITITASRPLVPVKVPFALVADFPPKPEGGKRPVQIAMRQRHTVGAADSVVRNSVLFGTVSDTTRLSVPVDVWVPGDTLFVIEEVFRDSVVVSGTTTTRVLDPATQRPIQQADTIVTFTSFALGCTSVSALTPGRSSCNPIRLGTRGATGYLPFDDGWRTRFTLVQPFDVFSEVILQATALELAALPAGQDPHKVRVVPNPYIVQSELDEITNRVGEARIIFTNVPDEGVLRIYSVSGQFLQQVTWTAADLLSRGRTPTGAERLPTGETAPLSGVFAQANGDLPYNLRTREGLDLGSGLYMYVIEGRGANSRGFRARGKFVIIR